MTVLTHAGRGNSCFFRGSVDLFQKVILEPE
jgi:hypothetical protein